MKKDKNSIFAGIILSFLILSIVPAMADNVTLNPIQPTTAGSFRQISWSSTGVFDPNASLDLFNNGILNTIPSPLRGINTAYFRYLCKHLLN